MLPRIEKHAEIYFCEVPCSQKRADQIAEAVALSWHWFIRLEKAVKSGRRLLRMENAKDVMNALAQKRKGFSVQRLPDRSTLRRDTGRAEHDHAQTLEGPVAHVLAPLFQDRGIERQPVLGVLTCWPVLLFTLSTGRVMAIRAGAAGVVDKKIESLGSHLRQSLPHALLDGCIKRANFPGVKLQGNRFALHRCDERDDLFRVGQVRIGGENRIDPAYAEAQNGAASETVTASRDDGDLGTVFCPFLDPTPW
jgi:hypothetical protein